MSCDTVESARTIIYRVKHRRHHTATTKISRGPTVGAFPRP